MELGNLKSLKSFLFEVLHPEPTDKYSMQLVRSGIVSVAAVVVNIGAYYVLKQLFGVHYLVSAPIGYGLGILVNYYLSIKWVFATRKLTNKHHEFIVFALINAAGLGIYELLIWSMVEDLNIGTLVAPVIATILVFFWNFLARKKLLY